MQILFLLVFVSSIIKTIPEQAQYFLDTKKLFDIPQTQKELSKLGFKKSCFTTEDNIKLCSFFLDKSDQEKVKGTIIYVAGFYPGLKEGMCSFYSLVVDQPYNILLFDARGHNESEGSFLNFSGIKNYGIHEYLDIVAAIQFVNQYNQENNIKENIIIHGICSGAYHTIKAVNYMRQKNYLGYNNIKGIIFDSGWFKVQDVAQDVIYAETEKRFKKGWLSWATKPIAFIIHQLYNLLFAKSHNQLENISLLIPNIECPIFFVHCDKDPYISITPVQELTKQCNCKYVWWIPHNSHANYHMHNYKEYKNKILEFLNIID